MNVNKHTEMDVSNILYGFLTQPHTAPSIQTVHISTCDLDGYACAAMSDVYEQIFNQGVYNSANQIRRYHISRNINKALSAICSIVRNLSHGCRTLNLLITGIDELEIDALVDALDGDEGLEHFVSLRIVFIGYNPASTGDTQIICNNYRSICSTVQAIRYTSQKCPSTTKCFTELLMGMARAMFLSPANSKKKSKGTKFNLPLATALANSVLSHVRYEDAELWRTYGGMAHRHQTTICEAANADDYGTRLIFEDPRKLEVLFQLCYNHLDSDPYRTFATLVSRIILNNSVLPAQYLYRIDRRLTEIAGDYVIFKGNAKECYCTDIGKYGESGTIWQCMLSDLPSELEHLHLVMKVSNHVNLDYCKNRYYLITMNATSGPVWDTHTRELYCKYYMDTVCASEDRIDYLDGYMFFIDLRNLEAPTVCVYSYAGCTTFPDIAEVYLEEHPMTAENEDKPEECKETDEDCDTACCDSKPQTSLSQLADAMSIMLRRFQGSGSANEPDQVDQTGESPAEQPDTTETEECADTACTPPEEDEPVPDPEPTATDEALAE